MQRTTSFRTANNYTTVASTPSATGDTVKEFGNNIMAIYQDKKNNYWFGSWETGLYKYDGKTILHFTPEHGLSSNRVDEIKEDDKGNIYFNTSEGVYIYDGGKFSRIPVSYGSRTDWKLEPGDMWFRKGYDSGLVCRYDGKFLYPLKFPETELGKKLLADNPGLANRRWSPYAVYSTYTDSKGNIWFGTAVLGVCRYNGKTFDWITEKDVNEMHNGPANGVRSIVEDKDGKFWFNTDYLYTIYNNNKRDSTFSYIREKGPGSLDGEDPDLTEYLSIAKDNNNELWIVTYTAGIYRYTGKKFIHYPVKHNGENIHTFCIYKDHKGDLWVGTHEHGVYKFNGKSFEKFVP